MNELRVPENRRSERLDVFLAGESQVFSRARWQKLIRDGFVLLNGKETRPREMLRGGETISWSEPPAEKIEAEAEQIPLHILFEDDDLIVLDKQAGLVVHPGAGNRTHTLVNALLGHGENLSGIGGRERPGIVHRLDKETSGCLVVAKNDAAHRNLAAQFAARTVEKIYLALVSGVLRQRAGTIDAEIRRHPVHRQRMAVAKHRGRSARTDYYSLGKGREISLVQCTLHSGRTHQIRVHLHHLGHPVLGDKLYGAKSGDFSRQMLHAWKLGFHHPRNSEWKTFSAPLPDDFRLVMKQHGLSEVLPEVK